MVYIISGHASYCASCLAAHISSLQVELYQQHIEQLKTAVKEGSSIKIDDIDLSKVTVDAALVATPPAPPPPVPPPPPPTFQNLPAPPPPPALSGMLSPMVVAVSHDLQPLL